MSFRHLLVGILMLAASGAAIALKPTQKLADAGPRIVLEQMIPQQFGEWQLENSVIPLKKNPLQEQKIAEIYDQAVSRTYVNNSGNKIMVYVGYGSRQNQNLKAHRQEICYAAQGFEIKNLKHQDEYVGGVKITLTRMLAISRHRTEPVTYWFTVGDRVVQSHLQRLVAQLRYGLIGVIPDGILVRISSLNPNEQVAYQEHLSFINEMLKIMPLEHKERLVGTF